MGARDAGDAGEKDEINDELAAGASFSPLPRFPRARPIFPSPFPFLAPATQAILVTTTRKWPIQQQEQSS